MKSVMLMAVLMSPMVLFAQDKKNGEQAFQIDGTVTALQKPAKLYLKRKINGENQLDSTELKDGKFSFSGTLAEPAMSHLLLKIQDPAEAAGYRKDVLALFLDKGTITITAKDSISTAKVAGSPAHDDFVQLNGFLKDINDQLTDLQQQYRQLYMAKDEEGMKKLEPEFDKLEAEQKTIMGNYLKSNTSSPIALFVLNQYAGYDINTAEVEPIYNQLSKKLHKTPSGKDFARKLELAKKTAVGQPATEFIQPDAEGKNISLASYKGKYLLLDFWASWCGPCRAENPNVVRAYSKFKDKGFDVLAVSLDDKKDKWQAAIQADNLPWTHVSDLKGWKNAAAEQYGIRAIPQNLLLDPNGQIIARNLRGDALEKKLAEILK